MNKIITLIALIMGVITATQAQTVDTKPVPPVLSMFRSEAALESYALGLATGPRGGTVYVYANGAFRSQFRELVPPHSVKSKKDFNGLLQNQLRFDIDTRKPAQTVSVGAGIVSGNIGPTFGKCILFHGYQQLVPEQKNGRWALPKARFNLEVSTVPVTFKGLVRAELSYDFTNVDRENGVGEELHVHEGTFMINKNQVGRFGRLKLTFSDGAQEWSQSYSLRTGERIEVQTYQIGDAEITLGIETRFYTDPERISFQIPLSSREFNIGEIPLIEVTTTKKSVISMAVDTENEKSLGAWIRDLQDDPRAGVTWRYIEADSNGIVNVPCDRGVYHFILHFEKLHSMAVHQQDGVYQEGKGLIGSP